MLHTCYESILHYYSKGIYILDKGDTSMSLNHHGQCKQHGIERVLFQGYQLP